VKKKDIPQTILEISTGQTKFLLASGHWTTANFEHCIIHCKVIFFFLKLFPLFFVTRFW